MSNAVIVVNAIAFILSTVIAPAMLAKGNRVSAACWWLTAILLLATLTLQVSAS